MAKLNTLSLSLILSLSLVACGGGGGSTVPPTSVLPTITVPIPASSYLAGSAELGGYTVLQQARVLCGFGALRQDTRLDAASRAHAIYQVNKSFPSTTPVLSHYERDDSKLPALVPDVTNLDYTGEFPWDRTDFTLLGTDYGRQVAEILVGTRWDYVNLPTFPTMEQRGTESMRSLLNTVYHLAGAMYYGADVGFGVHIDTKMIPNTTTWREEYRFGALNGYQTSTITLGTGNLATYPCQGSSNIPPSFVPAYESPNPFPEMTLSTQKVGPPIYLKLDEGPVYARQVLTVSLNSRIVSQSGVNVPFTVLTNATDPNIDPINLEPYIGLNEAFVVPLVALIPNTTYTVSLAGTINGVPFSRSFDMSTGPAEI